MREFCFGSPSRLIKEGNEPILDLPAGINPRLFYPSPEEDLALLAYPTFFLALLSLLLASRGEILVLVIVRQPQYGEKYLLTCGGWAPSEATL